MIASCELKVHLEIIVPEKSNGQYRLPISLSRLLSTIINPPADYVVPAVRKKIMGRRFSQTFTDKLFQVRLAAEEKMQQSLRV